MKSATAVFLFGILSVGMTIAQDDSSIAPSEEVPYAQELKLMRKMFTSMFNKVDLEVEQKSKVLETIEKNLPKLAEAKHEFTTVLSPEEKKDYLAHFRFARVAKFTIERSQNYALNKLELSDERKAQYIKAKEAADLMDRKFKNEIVSLLTKEQRQKIPMLGKGVVREISLGLKLPNMKTEENKKQIVDIFSAIDGVTVQNANLQKQSVKMHLEDTEEVRNAVLEILTDDEEIDPLFKDFSYISQSSERFKELLKPKSRTTDKSKSNTPIGSGT